MNKVDLRLLLNELTKSQNILISDVRRNSGYLARQEIEMILDNIRKDSKRLEPFGLKIYSQGDEDGILEEIFKRLAIQTGTFCEIGVENGLECNSLALILKGWRGFWLEGNETKKFEIENKFSSILNTNRLGLGIGMVTTGNVNEVISQMCARQKIEIDNLDFLSIDIDGMDIYLLEEIKFTPKVICIEYNAKFPPPLFKKPILDNEFRWRGTDYVGSSLCAIAESASRKGYSLVATNITGANAFLVRKDLLADHFVEDLSPAALYNPPRYYLIYDHYSTNTGHKADFGPYTDLI